MTGSVSFLLVVIAASLAVTAAHGWGRSSYWGRPRRYSRGGALKRMACQVTDSDGGLVQFRRCRGEAECSLGPLSVDWEGDTANLLFCTDKGDFLYEAACLTRSPDTELDTDRGCRGENNTCSVGPITIEFDGSPVETTFCSKPEGGCGRRWYRRTPASSTPSPVSTTTAFREPADGGQEGGAGESARFRT